MSATTLWAPKDPSLVPTGNIPQTLEDALDNSGWITVFYGYLKDGFSDPANAVTLAFLIKNAREYKQASAYSNHFTKTAEQKALIADYRAKRKSLEILWKPFRDVIGNIRKIDGGVTGATGAFLSAEKGNKVGPCQLAESSLIVANALESDMAAFGGLMLAFQEAAKGDTRVKLRDFSPERAWIKKTLVAFNEIRQDLSEVAHSAGTTPGLEEMYDKIVSRITIAMREYGKLKNNVLDEILEALKADSQYFYKKMFATNHPQLAPVVMALSSLSLASGALALVTAIVPPLALSFSVLSAAASLTGTLITYFTSKQDENTYGVVAGAGKTTQSPVTDEVLQNLQLAGVALGKLGTAGSLTQKVGAMMDTGLGRALETGGSALNNFGDLLGPAANTLGLPIKVISHVRLALDLQVKDERDRVNGQKLRQLGHETLESSGAPISTCGADKNLLIYLKQAQQGYTDDTVFKFVPLINVVGPQFCHVVDYKVQNRFVIFTSVNVGLSGLDNPHETLFQVTVEWRLDTANGVIKILAIKEATDKAKLEFIAKSLNPTSRPARYAVSASKSQLCPYDKFVRGFRKNPISWRSFVLAGWEAGWISVHLQNSGLAEVGSVEMSDESQEYTQLALSLWNNFQGNICESYKRLLSAINDTQDAAIHTSYREVDYISLQQLMEDQELFSWDPEKGYILNIREPAQDDPDISIWRELSLKAAYFNAMIGLMNSDSKWNFEV
ncbi:hypothetical protein OTB20_39905 [Streptomyces sp. H27-H1]|uniref:hypothetical protein n=1 Tax=Streptomyces sp. H27-H1 TaxID=2996461 RepID=UPI00226F5D84|nr:hypothetical protein [Streptomyces sp. H27-H1]MCY0932220.1 hypothetical protein [Streptomyces sp. H27-H1]